MNLLVCAQGGGIYVFGGSGSLNNCSLSGNSASSGAGIYIVYGTLYLGEGTVVQKNVLTSSFGTGSQLQVSGGEVRLGAWWAGGLAVVDTYASVCLHR